MIQIYLESDIIYIQKLPVCHSSFDINQNQKSARDVGKG